MHDQELLRRDQYDQDNGPPDDLYVVLKAYPPSASPGVYPIHPLELLPPYGAHRNGSISVIWREDHAGLFAK
jgi:hypothetical protein